jgi:uncharacterized protein
MPSNVSLEFAEAQKKYNKATTDEEKLVALQEMKSTAPHHKGAENLRAEINRKLSALKASMERQKTQKAKKGSAPSMYVKKDGIGQIAILGLPNTGKSWLLNKLVGKEIAEVTNYPFSTYKPEPGMMDYEGGKLQIVELPAIIEGSAKGKSNGREIISLARNADALIIVGNKDEQKIVEKELEKSKIFINKTRPKIKVSPSNFSGIQISGKKYLRFPEEQLIGYLKNTGHANANVIISGQINSLTEVSEALNTSIVYRKTLFINAREVTEHSLVDLRDKLFLLLDKILVYTKKPGKEVEKEDPMAMKKGSTLEDMAQHLHKDFANKLKFAKVWGSTKFPGQRVGPDYELKNKDVVEINI